MRRIVAIMMAMAILMSANAKKYSYTFSNTPLSEALMKVGEDHTDLNLSFIYKELENYKTSAHVNTDNPYVAVKDIVGLNPISVIQKNNDIYVEAFQHGKYVYTGRAVGMDYEPIIAATVMILEPKDSTVLTYGITDERGCFSIPCDRQGVIGKLTSIGYKPLYKNFESFNVGVVRMTELPVKLKTITVDGDDAILLADKSIYRPSQRQKNASQTATDLLVRMAIPQLNARLGSSGITTASGLSVAMYIDFVPATELDLKMMRVSDVKTVEYLEFPSDPRFQGNKNVINFRMVKYEYGGYVKALGTENFIANSGFGQVNARLVKKNMTYDIMVYGYYMANNHFGNDQTESFRLPQENGEIKSFQRESMTMSSKFRRQKYETSFRALYSSDKITANNQIDVGLDKTPHNDNEGVVRFSDDILPMSSYLSLSENKAKYINFSGYYFFSLPKSSSLTASVDYSYSHTDQSSRYSETHMQSIGNGADDDTHNGNVSMNYNVAFSGKHSFMTLIRWLYENNRTNYSGSVEALDKSITKFGQIGASYSFTDTKFSASLGFGWNWLSTSVNDNNANSSFPYIDAYMNYVPNKKNSFGTYFHYSVWPPSSNYKSENIIHVSPFLWHTGNPMLKSHISYDLGISYTFIPSNKYNMTVFANSWMVGKRAAFVYEATPEGIIRTIQQPIGSFRHFNYGINVSTRQLDGKLHLSGQIAQLYVQNGKPYNVNHSYISYYLQALYYLGNFNFAISYQSDSATDNYDCMSGFWTRNKDAFTLQAGWSNSSWNIRLTAKNPQRWNWRSSYETMNSRHYSVDNWTSNASSHAFVQLSATYTFGFGKKIDKDNDISNKAKASSGILK